MQNSADFCQLMFQSTLPMKGATMVNAFIWHGINVSIHAPNEGSDYIDSYYNPSPYVSIHAPNEGSDHGGR